VSLVRRGTVAAGWDWCVAAGLRVLRQAFQFSFAFFQGGIENGTLRDSKKRFISEAQN
jgi:hypothetical protein